MNSRLPQHELVLLGAGHTNCHVLRMWRMAPLADTRLTCISSHAEATYSGMLPGTLAGLDPPGRMRIDLRRLCAAAGARLIVGAVRGINPGRRLVLMADRPPIPYSLLSIGVGSVPAGMETLDSQTVVPIKPMQTFLDRLTKRLREVGIPQAPVKIAVVGAGAGGVEIALGLPGFFREVLGDRGCDITLIDSHDTLRTLPTPRGNVFVRDELTRRGIRLELGRRVDSVEGNCLQFSDGREIKADVVLWATSAAPAPLLAHLPLPKDDRGFLLIGPTLRVVDQDSIFAVGDCGSIAGAPTPKAGVYAVRQGPILWENLRRSISGQPLVNYQPQKGFLKLLSTGDGRAILSYGRIATVGQWCWRLKDRIDGRFMDMYQDYSITPMSTGNDPASVSGHDTKHEIPPRCTGCGSKVGGTVLRNVLTQLSVPTNDRVVVGIQDAEDAAVIRVGDEPTLSAAPEHSPQIVATHDFFTSPVDDAYLAGRIAAIHAAGDLIAMGSRPTAALAAISLPRGPANRQEEQLRDCLSGVTKELQAMNAALVGGHTIEAAEFMVGLTMLGERPATLRTKSALRIGDLLMLTKPLGIGILLAAHMRAMCQAAWYERLIDVMLVSPFPLLEVLADRDVSGVTDVTGFGLAGHLLEMLEASQVSAELHLAAIPLLEGVESLCGAGVESTLAPANRDSESLITWSDGSSAREAAFCRPPLAARFAAVFDPQTCGGLLLGIAAREADEIAAAVRRLSGISPAIIGRVTQVGDAPRIQIRTD